MFFLFFIFVLVFYEVESKEYCEVHDIFLKKNKNMTCEKGKLLFGYQEFNSNQSQYEYVYDDNFKVFILKIHKNKILDYLEKFCLKNNSLKIKEITNLNDNLNFKFKTKIIISCNVK